LDDLAAAILFGSNPSPRKPAQSFDRSRAGVADNSLLKADRLGVLAAAPQTVERSGRAIFSLNSKSSGRYTQSHWLVDETASGMKVWTRREVTRSLVENLKLPARAALYPENRL
jgi:hypothetical protein